MTLSGGRSSSSRSTHATRPVWSTHGPMLLLEGASRCAAFMRITKAFARFPGLLAGRQKIARQQSLSRPHLHHGEWIWMTPAGIERLFGQCLSENGMYPELV